jgi:hypothetical protein
VDEDDDVDVDVDEDDASVPAVDNNQDNDTEDNA